MKVLNTRVYLLQILLLCLACGLAFWGLVFFEQEITFWPNNWGYIEHNQSQFPVVLGVVSFVNFAFFLSYLALYLVFEFYGFRSSFYGLMGTVATLSLSYFAFVGLRWLNMNEGIDFFPKSVLAFLDHKRFQICLTLLSFAIGGFISLALAAIIRKITAGYFMFLRYPIASSLGLSCFALAVTFLTSTEIPSWEDRLLQGATPAAQFIVAVVATLIPLYLIRMLCGIFKGGATDASPVTPVEENQKSASPTQTPIASGLADTPFSVPKSAPPKVQEDETTASQKIHRDRLAL